MTASLPHIVDDRFEVVRKLGSGSFGDVWLAKDLSNQSKEVALKILHRHMAQKQDILRRFSREVELLAGLEHPNIASAVAWNIDLEQPFLAMQFITGTPLNRRLADADDAKSPLPLGDVERIMDGIGAAVAHAHDHRVVHRDLKPANIIIDDRPDGPFATVLDFGVAKILGEGASEATTAGRQVGSLLYMSPELMQNNETDHRADVFALGIILFELLTLANPWVRRGDKPAPASWLANSDKKNNHLNLMMRLTTDARPKVSEVRPGLPADLDSVVEQALAIEPEDRFQSVAALTIALAEALPEEERRPSSDLLVAPRRPSPPSSRPERKPSNRPTMRPRSSISTSRVTPAKGTIAKSTPPPSSSRSRAAIRPSTSSVTPAGGLSQALDGPRPAASSGLKWTRRPTDSFEASEATELEWPPSNNEVAAHPVPSSPRINAPSSPRMNAPPAALPKAVPSPAPAEAVSKTSNLSRWILFALIILTAVVFGLWGYWSSHPTVVDAVVIEPGQVVPKASIPTSTAS